MADGSLFPVLLSHAANNNAVTGFTTINANGQPIAFRGLNTLSRVFPISESTTFFSGRVDHAFNSYNQMTVRFGYNPSDLTGIQDESQNQTVGQNDFSRTGIQKLRDTSFVVSLASTITRTLSVKRASVLGVAKLPLIRKFPEQRSK